jgi:gamma-glutamylcyclotransferase (GGCT)/AIG2-like uncharacterized protein YtfP
MNQKEQILKIKAELRTAESYTLKALNHLRDLQHELARQARKTKGEMD